jgi:hypothetical protein
MRRFRRPCLGLALLVFALALVVAVPATAAHAAGADGVPCWKRLLNDWYDGRIDNVYPIHCYQDTLKHLPADISVYSSAREDIQRALQSARANLLKGQQSAGPNALVPAETTTQTTTQTTTNGQTTTSATGSTPGGTDAGGGGTTSPGRKPPPGLPGVAQQLNSSSPSSIPVPLLVLGGLALALVAAGAIGLVVKRSQGRRPGT